MKAEVSNKLQEAFEAELQFHSGDRINFPYVLANQILTHQKAMLESEKTAQIVIESFVSMIPDAWKDDDFNKDIDKAVVTIKIDNRPLCCGNLRMNEKTCKKLGIEPWIDKKQLDYFAMQQACLNLLERRHLLLRKTFTERMTGRKAKSRRKDIKDKQIEDLSNADAQKG